MIGFTKERIEQFIKNPLEHGLTRSEQMEMARQLLTSMEQEPVAFIDRANLDYLESGADADVWPASGAGSDDVLLYAAPQLPQPAVPDIATVEKTYPDVQTNWQDAKMYAEGWNACRAAMLQSFGNSEQLNSPVIQDCSEDTKRLDWLDAQNKRLNEYHGTTYGWKFDANFQRNAMMLNDSNYPVMSVRQAIDEAIAAAPQQEVKP
ncbi:hypothetical protein [Enterobacter kobei]|uniref:hypothetical protein n=1 Tax=Enterobacter kobei TaxID=208224 RepID=UPI0039C4B5BB